MKKTPSILERYELKFIIPMELIGPISDFVSVYCSLDKYSEAVPDRFYKVNSLYFDTPYFLFLRNRLAGAESRFNMRIRSYGDTPKLPYFLEIKQKRGSIIHKYRGRVYEDDWDAILRAPQYHPNREVNVKELTNIQRFRHQVLINNAEPKVLTNYLRKAYVSNYEDYARVTFDIKLKYIEETRVNLVPDEEQMVSYDFSNGPGSVVLELKCYTTNVPLWMIDCIRAFGLHRCSFSKYATGVAEVLQMHRYDPAYTMAVGMLG